MTTKIQKFIPRSVFPNYRMTLADFKGHHLKALHSMYRMAPEVDLILEVRDARAPLSTRNLLFDKPFVGKEKVILYSKGDLSLLTTKILDKWHEPLGEKYLMVDSRRKDNAQLILDVAKQKYESMYPRPPLGLRVVITGMPNVGKSTLVNSIRASGIAGAKKVAVTGGQPGITRSTSSIIRISRDPSIYLYDTPGVFLPTIATRENMLIMSIIGSVKRTLVDPVVQADFLLYQMNKLGLLTKFVNMGGMKRNFINNGTDINVNELQFNHSFYNKYLERPTNNLDVLLFKIAKSINRVTNKKTKEYDEIGTSLHWIDSWTQGKEGRIAFDDFTNPDAYKEQTERESERIKEMGIEENLIRYSNQEKRKKRFNNTELFQGF